MKRIVNLPAVRPVAAVAATRKPQREADPQKAGVGPPLSGGLPAAAVSVWDNIEHPTALRLSLKAVHEEPARRNLTIGQLVDILA